MKVKKVYISMSLQILPAKRNAIGTIFLWISKPSSVDGLFDTGAITSAIFDADLNKMKLLSNAELDYTRRALNFQIVVAIGPLERPTGTAFIEIAVADF